MLPLRHAQLYIWFTPPASVSIPSSCRKAMITLVRFLLQATGDFPCFNSNVFSTAGHLWPMRMKNELKKGVLLLLIASRILLLLILYSQSISLNSLLHFCLLTNLVIVHGIDDTSSCQGHTDENTFPLACVSKKDNKKWGDGTTRRDRSITRLWIALGDWRRIKRNRVRTRRSLHWKAYRKKGLGSSTSIMVMWMDHQTFMILIS